MTTTATPKLPDSSAQTMLALLAAAKVPAEWSHTGGNCYGIEVPLADGSYLLVTDYEGPMEVGDLTSDDARYGWYVGRYDADGSPWHEGNNPDDEYVYASHVDDESYDGPMQDVADATYAVTEAVAVARNATVTA